jgi:hypothetical protein
MSLFVPQQTPWSTDNIRIIRTTHGVRIIPILSVLHVKKNSKKTPTDSRCVMIKNLHAAAREGGA